MSVRQLIVPCLDCLMMLVCVLSTVQEPHNVLSVLQMEEPTPPDVKSKDSSDVRGRILKYYRRENAEVCRIYRLEFIRFKITHFRKHHK